MYTSHHRRTKLYKSFFHTLSVFNSFWAVIFGKDKLMNLLITVLRAIINEQYWNWINFFYDTPLLALILLKYSVLFKCVLVKSIINTKKCMLNEQDKILIYILHIGTFTNKIKILILIFVYIADHYLPQNTTKVWNSYN